MKAYELVEKGWCQKAAAINEDKYSVPPHAGNAVAWCVDGALRLVYGKSEGSSSELDAKRDFLKAVLRKDGWWSLVRWNDYPGRTQAEAVALLKAQDL